MKMGYWLKLQSLLFLLFFFLLGGGEGQAGFCSSQWRKKPQKFTQKHSKYKKNEEHKDHDLKKSICFFSFLSFFFIIQCSDFVLIVVLEC